MNNHPLEEHPVPAIRLTIPPLSVQKAARKVLAWMAEEGLFNMDIMGIGDEEGQVLLVERVILAEKPARTRQ